MSKISRKAVLISYPGKKGEENYCPGVFVDMKNYVNFLQSPLGGAWEYDKYSDILSEIKLFPSPKKTELLSYLQSIKLHDYVIIGFCGHGGYSLYNRQTKIKLNDQNDTVLEEELKQIGIRENIILDCCRVLIEDLVFSSESLLEKVAFSSTRRQLNERKCRLYYDETINKCSPGINILYGCDITETSGDSAVNGGYYSSGLIKAAKIWEQEINVTLPSDKYSILSFDQAHENSKPFVKRRKADQNPQISKNGINFPWAVASY